jgi:hypothetical protein
MDSHSFHANVEVINDESMEMALQNRLNLLLDGVIARLPNEEQFLIPGRIAFLTRYVAIESLREHMQSNPSLNNLMLDFTRPSNDGKCIFYPGETIDTSSYTIAIIVDNLHNKSDNYIKGLIAHELAEMSYMWRIVQKELPILLRMKPKARQVRLGQLGKHQAPIGSEEHERKENEVNDEAIRLGFQKEISALESSS